MRRITIAVTLWFMAIATAWAQEQTGVLQGRAVDGSGAALPGATVTVAGPTILGGSRSTSTSETGAYRLPAIPIGLYKVTFELTGFQTKVYEDIRVQAGVTFSLDAQLGVAAVQETVTVSGASPIIDSAATSVSFTYTKELMNTIPNARDVWAMVSQAPGMTTAALNVGGSNTGNQTQFRAHGSDPRQNTFILAGANVTDNSGTGGSQFYYDIDSFDEMQIEMNSHPADVQTPGVVLNMVPRAGTNTLRGTGSVYYGDDRVQSNNVDDALRGRGVNRASNLKSYFDGGFDLGGPILSDKLWFWGAYRYQDVKRFVTGVQNADGSFPIDRTFLWYPTGKLNWQATAAHNASLFFNMQQKKRFNAGLSALRPRETTADQQNDPISRVVSLRDDWVATPRLLVSAKAYYLKGAFRTSPVDGVNAETPPQLGDLDERVFRGAAVAPAFVPAGAGPRHHDQLHGRRLRRPARSQGRVRVVALRGAGRDHLSGRPPVELPSWRPQRRCCSTRLGVRTRSPSSSRPSSKTDGPAIASRSTSACASITSPATCPKKPHRPAASSLSGSCRARPTTSSRGTTCHPVLA